MKSEQWQPKMGCPKWLTRNGGTSADEGVAANDARQRTAARATHETETEDDGMAEAEANGDDATYDVVLVSSYSSS